MDEGMDGIEMLRELTSPEEVDAVRDLLSHLKRDTDLTLFVGEGCAVCPHQVRAVATVTLASERIGLEIVDAADEPELAERHDIRAVPTTVVDDELVLVGVVPAPELAWRLVERQGPEAQAMIFGGLVRSNLHADAAERMSDGRGTGPFLELWKQAEPELRALLFQVAEQSKLFDPDCLAPMVAGLAEALFGDGELAADPDHRADTADLLGFIGHPDARPPLERLAADADSEVAAAAREALAELEGGSA